MLSPPEIVYVTVVLAVGCYALVRIMILLARSRIARIRSIEKRRRFEAVSTDGPIDDPKEVARERGVQSIEKQFTVLRRVLVPLIIGATLILAAVPFFAGTSAATASMIGAVLAVVFGLALRPFLENAVAGIVISSSRLVRIGDTIRIDDWYGTVEDITATHTAVKVWDWRRYLVPNGRMLQSTFMNYSLFDPYVWAHVEFFVAPDADLDVVREVAVRTPLESRHFSQSEDPAFWITGIEKDAVRCWVAAWAHSPSDAWLLTNDIRSALLKELRARGIPLSLQRHQWSDTLPGARTGRVGGGETAARVPDRVTDQ